MSNKVPCGGFYLDDMLGIDENGKLGVNGGEPFKQLVTDSEGNAKWEDRLAYDVRRVIVNSPESQFVQYVKVSDDIPEWVSDGVSVNIFMSNGNKFTTTALGIANGCFAFDESVFIVGVDNIVIDDLLVFPQKGVYFLNIIGAQYTSGISIGTSDTPEITWDGNVDIIKKLDSKFIPSELNEVILPSSTSGSSKKFKITVNDSGTITATEVTT